MKALTWGVPCPKIERKPQRARRCTLHVRHHACYAFQCMCTMPTHAHTPAHARKHILSGSTCELEMHGRSGCLFLKVHKTASLSFRFVHMWKSRAQLRRMPKCPAPPSARALAALVTALLHAFANWPASCGHVHDGGPGLMQHSNKCQPQTASAVK